jgi:hypothetical protein
MTRPLEIHLPRLPSLFAHNLHISNAEGEKRQRQIYFFCGIGAWWELALMGLDKISDET